MGLSHQDCATRWHGVCKVIQRLPTEDIIKLERENAQLNTQVTELQQRGTELVEENRVLRRENEALRLDLAETQSLLTSHEDNFGHP